MAVSAQNQIGVMLRFQLVENVRRMREQERKPVRRLCGQAAEVGPVQRGIIHSDEGQFAAVCVDRRRFVDEQRNLMPLRPVAELFDGNAAVVVMVAQRHVDRGDGPQLREKSKEMRQAFGDVQQVAGNENPVRLQSFDLAGNRVMAQLVAVEMEIAQMHGPVSRQYPMGKGQAGHGMVRQADFALRK